MNVENLITAAICLAAAAYVGNSMYASLRKAWGPKGSGCGGCGDGESSCSSDETPASGASQLVQLKRRK